MTRRHRSTPPRWTLTATPCAKGLLGPAECRALPRLWANDGAFRSRVVMQSHGFGRGEYKYFAYPLPEPVARLRAALYPRAGGGRQPLERGAGRERALSADPRRRGSRAATPPARRGRRRCCCATAPGDYNCLHQDLYGDAGLPAAGGDPARAIRRATSPAASSCWSSSGRACSRAARSCRCAQGDAVIFAVQRAAGAGHAAASTARAMRHGVSRVRAGERFTLGIIFHDARRSSRQTRSAPRACTCGAREPSSRPPPQLRRRWVRRCGAHPFATDMISARSSGMP